MNATTSTPPPGHDLDELERLRRENQRLRELNADLVARVEAAPERPEALAAAMAELERSNAALKLASAAEQAACRAKSEFLATMSHEMRTPLNGVLGMVELLLGGEIAPRQRKLAETIQRSALGLLTVINDLLDFSRIEAGQLELECLELDLRDVLEDTCELHARAARAKGLELICLVPPTLDARVMGDPARLRQICTNLVGNAIKFTERGHVVVGLEEAVVEEGRRRLRLHVSDTGIGIPEALQTRLFSAFSQADGSMSRRHGGTGLGLAIVKRLCQLMDGDVVVDSTPGAGSTFSCHLRLAAAPARPDTASDSSESLVPSFAGRQALVVDPSVLVRRALVQELAARGIACEEADGERDAAERLRGAASRGQGFALVFAASATGVPASARFIRLAHDGDVGARTGTIELMKPIRRWRLLRALRQAAGEDTSGAQTVRPASAPSPQLGLRVLVAEDNLINQEVTIGLCEALGCEVRVVADGRALVELVAPGRWDVVLLDCQMPVMDGFEAARELRRRERAEGWPRQRVVAVTANASDEVMQACQAAGMDDFLCKPFSRQALAGVLERAAAGVTASRAPAPAPAPAVAAMPPVLDTRILARIRLAQPGGRGDLVSTVVGMFLRDSPAQLAAILEAADAGDAARLASQAHALRGAGANLGLARLAGALAQLESHARGGALGECAPVCRKLVALHDEATRALRREVPEGA